MEVRSVRRLQHASPGLVDPAAWFGLGGVALGGFVTFGVEYTMAVIARRSAKRSSARIVFDELGWWAAGVRYAIEQDNPLLLGDQRPAHAVWVAHRDSLVSLDPSSWDTVVSGVLSTNSVPQNAFEGAGDLLARLRSLKREMDEMASAQPELKTEVESLPVGVLNPSFDDHPRLREELEVALARVDAAAVILARIR